MIEVKKEGTKLRREKDCKKTLKGEKRITLEKLGDYIILGCPHCYRSYCE